MRYKRERFLSIEISSRPISKIGAIFSYKSIRRSETWIGDRQVGNAGLHIIHSSMRDECIYDVCVHDEEGISYEIHITWRIDEARATLRQRSEAVGLS